MQDVILTPNWLTIASFVCATIAIFGIGLGVAVIVSFRVTRSRSVSRRADCIERGRCPICSNELPPGSPQGLCPRCLLQAAMDEPTVPPPPVSPSTAAYNPGFAAMTPQELASHF